jgi:hypothetical protein
MAPLEHFNLEPLEGSFEKVNKTKFWVTKINETVILPGFT